MILQGEKNVTNCSNPGFTGTPLHNSPFLRQGNLKSFTRPKSSPVTKTSFWKLASQALTSLVSVYFSQIPFTSTPKTPVQVAQWIALSSSLFAMRFPPYKNEIQLKSICIIINSTASTTKLAKVTMKFFLDRQI